MIHCSHPKYIMREIIKKKSQAASKRWERETDRTTHNTPEEHLTEGISPYTSLCIDICIHTYIHHHYGLEHMTCVMNQFIYIYVSCCVCGCSLPHQLYSQNCSRIDNVVTMCELFVDGKEWWRWTRNGTEREEQLWTQAEREHSLLWERTPHQQERCTIIQYQIHFFWGTSPHTCLCEWFAVWQLHAPSSDVNNEYR